MPPCNDNASSSQTNRTCVRTLVLLISHRSKWNTRCIRQNIIYGLELMRLAKAKVPDLYYLIALHHFHANRFHLRRFISDQIICIHTRAPPCITHDVTRSFSFLRENSPRNTRSIEHNTLDRYCSITPIITFDRCFVCLSCSTELFEHRTKCRCTLNF